MEETLVRKPASREAVLSWMASLSLAAAETRAAEGYLLELLAWAAFSEFRPLEVQ